MKLRLMLWKLFTRMKPQLRPAQIWWDNTGHVSHCDSRKVYILLGKDFGTKEEYWHCGSVAYCGRKDTPWTGGPLSKLTDKEILEMTYLGYLPTWKLRLTIGAYKDFMLDRKWAEQTTKPVLPSGHHTV